MKLIGEANKLMDIYEFWKQNKRKNINNWIPFNILRTFMILFGILFKKRGYSDQFLSSLEHPIQI